MEEIENLCRLFRACECDPFVAFFVAIPLKIKRVHGPSQEPSPAAPLQSEKEAKRAAAEKRKEAKLLKDAKFRKAKEAQVDGYSTF